MYSHLLSPNYREDIVKWIKDDCPTFDIGGFVVGEKIEQANLLCKSSGVLAGVPYVDGVYQYLGLTVSWKFEEGTYIDTTQGKVIVATITGPIRNILLAERTSLNIITRASGIATECRRALEIVKSVGWHGNVSGTRKTTPGFKFVEKYALVVGGCATHRHDLSQMVMLKDNHIWSCGSITNAVIKARSVAGFSIKIEVECQNLEEGLEAAHAGADIVMLDNHTAEQIAPAAKKIKELYPSVLIEASGVSSLL